MRYIKNVLNKDLYVKFLGIPKAIQFPNYILLRFLKKTEGADS